MGFGDAPAYSDTFTIAENTKTSAVGESLSARVLTFKIDFDGLLQNTVDGLVANKLILNIDLEILTCQT